VIDFGELDLAGRPLPHRHALKARAPTDLAATRAKLPTNLLYLRPRLPPPADREPPPPNDRAPPLPPEGRLLPLNPLDRGLLEALREPWLELEKLLPLFAAP
jgi:hypothetical protein